jgi:hypothetical protein
MTHHTDARRTKLYKWAIGLSIVHVADGAFMAWALLEGGWATLGYGQVSYFLPEGFAVVRLEFEGESRRDATIIR